MEEFEVKNAWIEKQHNKDKYKLSIYDGTRDNAYIYFTMEQLKILKKDIEKRIKKHSKNP